MKRKSKWQKKTTAAAIDPGSPHGVIRRCHHGKLLWSKRRRAGRLPQTADSATARVSAGQPLCKGSFRPVSGPRSWLTGRIRESGKTFRVAEVGFLLVLCIGFEKESL